jgi:peroxiredoxin
MNESLNTRLLKLGAVTPDFWLTTTSGETITRHAFRNKAGLILFFFTPSESAWTYLRSLAEDEAEYKELNVKIVAIARADADALPVVELPQLVTLLIDPTDKAWSAYTGLLADVHQEAVAVYVLDMYGGLEAQRVAPSIEELPTTQKVLEWSRGAQYRCNI